MTQWKLKIKGIRKLLSGDDSVETAKRVGKQIFNLLNSNMYKKYFEDFDFETGRELEEFNHVIDCNDLNSILHDLWNYCDNNLIWVEFDN